MGRLERNKELRELIDGKEVVIKTGLKNNIIKVDKCANIQTISLVTEDEGKKFRTTLVDSEIADLIVEHDISIGYDNTKDTGTNGVTKGYFIAYYKGGKQKLHRMVFKYLDENMSIDDIFNNKPSKCDGKEVHHINAMTFDSRYRNLKLCETVRDHNKYQENTSIHICLNQSTNQYTVADNFKEYIGILKSLGNDLKGELPKDNEDINIFYNELMEYIKVNEEIIHQE